MHASISEMFTVGSDVNLCLDVSQIVQTGMPPLVYLSLLKDILNANNARMLCAFFFPPFLLICVQILQEKKL